MVTRVGMLGISDGNGHPFSFSAIINGFSEPGLRDAGWQGIYDYVRRCHASEFGVGDMHVTHAWTQDAEQTARLCAAAAIPHSPDDYRDMIGEVDAVIIARDDPESHRGLAIPFLEAGIPVFVDKPLTLASDDLRCFAWYLRQGLLMSCSGMRYARELDTIRAGQVDHGELKLVRGMIVKDWKRYGVHLLDAILPLLDSHPVAVRPLPGGHGSVALIMSDGGVVTIDVLGEVPPIFRVELIGERHISRVDITDNFTMFRRTLWEFWRMVVEKRPIVPVPATLTVIRTLMAGQQALATGKEVYLDAIELP